MSNDVAAVPLRAGTREWRIGVINGTNMSALIYRDPNRFGPPQTIQDLEAWVEGLGRGLGVSVRSLHTDFDGEIITWMHRNVFEGDVDGILINPAGLTTYGDHVRHCLEESRVPYVEVHFANIAVTGHNSVFTRTAAGMVHGFRKHSYKAALVALISILDDDAFPKPVRHYRQAKPAG